jgi:hypothetical protein
MKQTQVTYGKNFVDLPMRMLPSEQLTTNPQIIISINFKPKGTRSQQVTIPFIPARMVDRYSQLPFTTNLT